jgi:Holliday junction resolvase RusA-like endonuclease
MAQSVRDDIARRTAERRASDLPEHWPAGPYSGAVSVTVEAYLTPPASWGSDYDARLSWPTWNQAGDLDKIVRNVLDALGSTSKNPKMNGGAIVDDNLVCRIVATKHVAGPSGALSAGVRIIVETL